MTTTNQSITGTINFEAFGQTAGSTGSSSSPYMYAGAWGYRTEGDAGLMHVGARYYDAQVGRFITRDTVLSEHPYLYCEHDPVNWVDPSGHDGWSYITQRASDLVKFNTPPNPAAWFYSGIVTGIGGGVGSVYNFANPPSNPTGNALAVVTGVGAIGGGAGIVSGGIGLVTPVAAGGAVSTGALIGGTIAVTAGIAIVGIGAAAVVYFGGKWLKWW